MKKIGAITIGQSPRTDVMGDVASLLNGVELLQAGALDGMTLEEVQALQPAPGGTTLVSRMADGTAVTLDEEKLLPLLQHKIEELERQGVRAILLLCTGTFPETFCSRVPLIYPSKVICAIVGALNGVRSLGVITPDAAQVEDIYRKWNGVVSRVEPVLWNPYLEQTSPAAVAQLQNAGVDMAVMDCFGYSRAMQTWAQDQLCKPVLLSRTIAVRVLLEIV